MEDFSFILSFNSRILYLQMARFSFINRLDSKFFGKGKIKTSVSISLNERYLRAPISPGNLLYSHWKFLLLVDTYETFPHAKKSRGKFERLEGWLEGRKIERRSISPLRVSYVWRWLSEVNEFLCAWIWNRSSRTMKKEVFKSARYRSSICRSSAGWPESCWYRWRHFYNQDMTLFHFATLKGWN